MIFKPSVAKVKPRISFKNGFWFCSTGRDRTIGHTPLEAWIGWARFYGTRKQRVIADQLEMEEFTRLGFENINEAFRVIDRYFDRCF